MRVTERILPNYWSNDGCASRGKQQGIQYKQLTSASSYIDEGHHEAVVGRDAGLHINRNVKQNSPDMRKSSKQRNQASTAS